MQNSLLCINQVNQFLNDYNNEKYYSDGEDDDFISNDNEEETFNTLIYSSDEKNTYKYCLALCELYNEKIHGQTNSMAKYNYLVNTRFKSFHFEIINNFANFINNGYLNHSIHLNHNIFRNYKNMVLNKYIKPEIVECFYIDGCCLAIFKTFWIKIIQRTWRNILKKKSEILFKRKFMSSLLHNKRNGVWPDDCKNYPTLKGMLSNLITRTSSTI